MLYMSGNLPPTTLDWEWVEDSIYLEPALKHASFLNNTLTEKDIRFRLENYYKFMMVRNPFERIVSAYRNKIEPHLQAGKLQFFPGSVRKMILKKYRPNELLYWQKTTRKFNISVTFSEFVRYLVSTPKSELNEHFAPSMDLCHPCLLKFNFHGNFKNYSHDAKQIISRLKANPKFYRDKSLHTDSQQTVNYLSSYFSQLSPRDKMQLFGAWYDELLFYYTLYPSERYHYKELLGIDIDIDVL